MILTIIPVQVQELLVINIILIIVFLQRIFQSLAR